MVFEEIQQRLDQDLENHKDNEERERAVGTLPTRTPRGWFQYGEIRRECHEGGFFYSIGGQPLAPVSEKLFR
jgi:hypothetical protein